MMLTDIEFAIITLAASICFLSSLGKCMYDKSLMSKLAFGTWSEENSRLISKAETHMRIFGWVENFSLGMIVGVIINRLFF